MGAQLGELLQQGLASRDRGRGGEPAPPTPPSGEGLRRLEGLLAEILEAARAAWPGLTLAPEAFLPYLGERLPAELSLEDGLGGQNARDLYLACACAQGQAAAIAELERRCLADLPRLLGARLRLPDDVAEDVQQSVRLRLLVADEGASPGITAYTGRGSLRGWVRVVALRDALMLMRGERRRAAHEPELLIAAPVAGSDPQAALLRQRHGSEFRDAFAKAFRGLNGKQRNVLRLHHIHGLSIDELSALYHVHRATAARWIAAAHALLCKETRHELAQRLHASPIELDSLVGRVESQVDFSLRSLLHTVSSK